MFATIGHIETWEKLHAVVAGLRDPELPGLDLEEVRSIVPWIPPRTVVNLCIRSFPSGKEALGIYVDTFIPPDELGLAYRWKNIARVQAAAAAAARAGARVASLGGFTSIVIEGGTSILQIENGPMFTTGNTLTAAYLAKGIEQACLVHGLDLAACRLLVVGATGDLGSACVRYFAGRVRELLLCARNPRRLASIKEELSPGGVRARIAVDAAELLVHADIVLLAASLTEAAFDLSGCAPHAVVCDAGYPKNARPAEGLEDRLFHGGMGRVLGGYSFAPDLRHAFYDFPLPHIGHGCMLEGALLALEERFESYSSGRGRITPDRIESIWDMAQRHGFVLAPFFHADGLWSTQSRSAAIRDRHEVLV